jgi:hypothetical protein
MVATRVGFRQDPDLSRDRRERSSGVAIGERFEANPQLGRLRAMTYQAQRADVLEIALAATLDHGHDVIRIPQRFARQAFQSPPLEQA